MTLLRLLVLACAMGWTVHQGFAPHYAPGVMDQVADNRGLDWVDCPVASPNLDIGNWVYVYGIRTGVLRYCRVTDVSEAIDRLRHIRMKRVVELSNRSAQVICGLEVMDDRPEQCPVVVVSEYE